MFLQAKLRLDQLSSRQRVFSEQLDPASESRFLEFYVRLIPRVLNAERCSVFIHDPAKGKVWLKAGTSVRERGIEVSLTGSVVGDVIATGTPVIATDLQSREGAHKRIDTTTGFVTREIMCVPIRSTDGSKVTGAIQVLNKKAGGFTQEDQRFLFEVGEHFQGIVESIYLGQEALSMTRSAVATATRAVVVSFIAVFASLFVITFFGIYGPVQPWFVDKPHTERFVPPEAGARAPSVR
jgi:GAF domain-containing protein